MIRRVLILMLVLAVMLSVGCESEAPQPRPKQWTQEEPEREPERPEPTPSPSPSQTDSDDSDRGERESYKGIDLENGDDIPEGSCGPYDAPKTSKEFRAIEDCNPGHEYGTCPLGFEPMGGGKVIVGSSGDDVLEGGPEDTYICGMGGNDIIIGGGGENNLWGGPGNDYIVGGTHSDFIYGGDGDDIIIGNNDCFPGTHSKCGADFLYGDSFHDADSGDDAIYGGTLSLTEVMDGGPGNDILVPTVARRHGATIEAGAGNDVVVTLDFSYGFVKSDKVNLGAVDGRVKLGMPLGKTCQVNAELDLQNPEDSGEGKVTCQLPWPEHVSGLDTFIPLTASIDQEGEVTMSADLYNQLAGLSVSASRDMTKFQASLGGDICICDPLANPAPSDPMPYDWDATTE